MEGEFTGRFEAQDAPEARTFPDPEESEPGRRGYEPIQPRWGIGGLLRRLAAPLVALGFCETLERGLQ